MSGRLVIDLGSSRLAWRLDQTRGGFDHLGTPAEPILRGLSKLPMLPKSAVVGSVADPKVTSELTDALQSLGVDALHLQATSECMGVVNGYECPSQLGIDRWAAIVAAFHRSGGPLAVVDCGTAITYDWVDQDGRHKGGAIGPGLGLMRDTLTRNTRLEWEPKMNVSSDLGRDTASAVEIGIRMSVAGMINGLVSRSRLGSVHAHQWITGGESILVVPFLEGSWLTAPDLVLDGLELIADSSS